ncbi:histidine phosphatase family protein [Schleiferilactobacillus perolens]|jgi:probable phosphoglycerate mutase|uniref:Phosphoglycerate mutase n=1 Tax=Schleiferilactobacillus perolens DSM 12744 TaxID=1423792 RepID=A0A0R1N7A4_9LACO|nr:histidine phosphatase family protein [Schleiferilactobacillus perolens]KRL14196.1 phosphoglycerate mutase [Schleiferilactobacillus perolens DSM 12744]MCI1913175.1 histidine phosphatase family protein [Schleiferilactobacillus harbinensis]MCI2171281.1 histidine phosphatase family protein [Schleiferilactobacillus perolens]
MTTLYFIRHGKTKWNLEGRYQGGHGDSPLLPESYADIERLARFLADHRYAALYTSPLPRAKMTAIFLQEQLAQTFPIYIDEGLREFNLGKMEGMRFHDVQQRFPSQIRAFRSEPALYDPRPIDGETFPEVIQRMRGVVNKVIKRDRTGDGRIILVSHGAALTALIQSLLGTPLADIRKQGGLTNTSTTIIKTEDAGQSFQLVKWNETSYLHKTLTKTDTI